MKYPGGYQIIDLGGIEISSTPADLPNQSSWDYAFQLKKPVYITNFTYPLAYLASPLLLTYDGDSGEFHAIAFASDDGRPLGYIKVSHTEPAQISGDEYQ